MRADESCLGPLTLCFCCTKLPRWKRRGGLTCLPYGRNTRRPTAARERSNPKGADVRDRFREESLPLAHGRPRVVVRPPWVRVPFERDLRRDQRILGLRTARCGAQEQSEGALVAARGARARRRGGVGQRHHLPSP